MRLLIVMIKEPITGQVKTRLGASVGLELASTYYKALVEILLKQLHGLNNCRIRFCFTPDDASDSVRFWILPELSALPSPEDKNVYLTTSPITGEKTAQEIDFRPQGTGSLDTKIANAFKQGFHDGFSEIALINSDCPECGARWINAAFSALPPSANNLIVGPSLQGNCYLIILSSALSSPNNDLLENLQWDKDKAFQIILERAKNADIQLKTLPQLRPIIDQSDWDALRQTPLNAAIKKILGEDLGEINV